MLKKYHVGWGEGRCGLWKRGRIMRSEKSTIRRKHDAYILHYREKGKLGIMFTWNIKSRLLTVFAGMCIRWNDASERELLKLQLFNRTSSHLTCHIENNQEVKDIALLRQPNTRVYTTSHVCSCTFGTFHCVRSSVVWMLGWLNAWLGFRLVGVSVGW